MASGPGIVLLNITALCLLLVCLRYGISRERNDVLVWTVSYSAGTVGFSFLNLENMVSRHVWNQLVATGGFLVGGLTFVAFQLHERHVRLNASGRSSADHRRFRDRKPLLLRARPPTRRRSNAEGGIALNSATLVGGLILTSALASTAAVAALGMNLRPFSAASPIPQEQTTRVLGFSRPKFVPTTDMAAIIYQSALLHTVGRSSATSNNRVMIDHGPQRIGCVNYPGLRTRGVGVDPAGLAKANPLNYMAPGLTIHSVQGVAIGTNMTAVCRDETSAWSWKHKQASSSPSSWRYESTFTHEADGTEHHPALPRRLTLAYSYPGDVAFRSWLEDSADVESDEDGSPRRLRQIFVLSRLGRTIAASGEPISAAEAAAKPCLSIAVLACDYAGQDVRHLVRLGGEAGSPLTFLEELGPTGEPLSVSDMRPAARAIDSVIGNVGLPGGGDGSMFTAGLAHGGRRWFELALKDLEHLLEDILTDAAQGYFSVLRQRVERWSVRSNKATADEWVRGLALRVGGGGWFWVGITATLATLPVVALFRMAKAWDRTGELLLAEICSDDGLSEDEGQAMFIARLALKDEKPPAYLD